MLIIATILNDYNAKRCAFCKNKYISFYILDRFICYGGNRWSSPGNDLFGRPFPTGKLDSK